MPTPEVVEIEVDKLIIGPGIYDNLSNADYHKAEGVSKSYLSKLNVIPAEAKLPDTETKYTLNSACHMLAGEGEDVFEESCIECTTKGDQTNAFKDMVLENPDKLVLVKDGKIKVRAIVDGMMQHPYHKELMEAPGICEQSLFWMEGDMLCKCRPDKRLTEQSIILDWKFVRKGKCSVKGFKWYIQDLTYDFQDVFYRLGALRALNIHYEKFIFVVTETEPPYRTQPFQIDGDRVDAALEEIKALMFLEKQCRQNNHWPSYEYDPNNPVEEIVFLS